MVHIRCLVLALLLAGCAANPDPIVDMQGVDPVRYQQDLADCKTYKDQIRTEVGVAKGAAGGAAVGGAIGAITGDAAQGAGVGAVAGGAESARLNEREKQRVVKNCMRGRGYRVLN
jgi:hypothetical protein